MCVRFVTLLIKLCLVLVRLPRSSRTDIRREGDMLSVLELGSQLYRIALPAPVMAVFLLQTTLGGEGHTLLAWLQHYYCKNI
jgi:hypothetical protein